MVEVARAVQRTLQFFLFALPTLVFFVQLSIHGGAFVVQRAHAFVMGSARAFSSARSSALSTACSWRSRALSACASARACSRSRRFSARS